MRRGVAIPYLVVRNGRAYFQPTKTMKDKGFRLMSLGPAGPEAEDRALALYRDWCKVRDGKAAQATAPPPPGSISEAFSRYRQSDEWPRKAARTREEWERAFVHIEMAIGDAAPSTVTLETISQLRSAVEQHVSLREAHRVIKIWRALWQVMAALKYCRPEDDPSFGVRNRGPRTRDLTWQEWEVARLTKRAWREGYHGLAALIAVAWDGMLAPVDVRTLTLGQRLAEARGRAFTLARTKTGRSAVIALTRRSARVLDAYVARLGLQLLDDAPIFRNRSGRPYSKDTLGDDFRTIREMVFPGDRRTLLDMRRAGAVEAVAGGAPGLALSATMGNSLSQVRSLEEAYIPGRAAMAETVIEARRIGRRKLSDSDVKPKG